MRTSTAAGGIAAILFGLAGLASTVLQLTQPGSGFEDTDDPAVSLGFLREHPENYLQQGIAFFVMAIALTILALAVWDAFAAGRSASLGVRTVSAVGLAAALCFFLFGVFRYSARPLLYIDGLDSRWGEAAYLVQQVAGIHGLAQGAILATSGWAVGVAILGYRSGALPRWLALLGVLPTLRLASGVGPLLPPEALPDWTWFVVMLAIPGTFIWFLILGIVLVRRAPRPIRSTGAQPVPDPA